MKSRWLFLFLSIFISFESFCQNSKPLSQSNQNLDFWTFLSGIKIIELYGTPPVNLDKLVVEENLNIQTERSETVTAYAIYNGVQNYFKYIGLNVISSPSKLETYNLNSICDKAEVTIDYKVNGPYIDISVKISSCNLDWWLLKVVTQYSNNDWVSLMNDTENLLVENYGNTSFFYRKENRYTSKGEKTGFDMTKFKDYLNQTQKTDIIEGIYESTGYPKYIFGIKKNNESYDLIYFSGANYTEDWTSGDLKAHLVATAKPFLFKTSWYLENKQITENAFISIEDALMNIIINDNILKLIKTYPTIADSSNQTKEPNSSGTGFAISPDGILVTCFHVVENAKMINIRGVNGDLEKKYKAKVILSDKNNDLALIKINDSAFNTIGTIPYMISDNISDVGTTIFIMGYPLLSSMGDEIKLTDGIISSKSGYKGDVTLYQITAAAQPGNSGSPLFDKTGKLIGVVNAKHIEAENATYAIKSNYLLNLIESLPTTLLLPEVNSLKDKPLPEQIRLIKSFVYLIEVTPND